MAAIATVENGKLVQNTSNNAAKKTTDGMDKDSFLQLLVAQMKYQDPLEPTSNTESISQYAQFSQVQELQNVSGSMDLQRASALVGKEVWVETTTSTGMVKPIRGRVDYVVYDNGKPYVAINEELYELSKVNTVVDKVYQEAYDKAYDFVTALNKLPSINGLDLSDGEAIDKLEKTYNEMDDYQKSFIAKEKVDILNKYIEKIKEVRLIENPTDPDEPDGDDSDPKDPDETKPTE